MLRFPPTRITLTDRDIDEVLRSCQIRLSLLRSGYTRQQVSEMEELSHAMVQSHISDGSGTSVFNHSVRQNQQKSSSENSLAVSSSPLAIASSLQATPTASPLAETSPIGLPTFPHATVRQSSLLRFAQNAASDSSPMTIRDAAEVLQHPNSGQERSIDGSHGIFENDDDEEPPSESPAEPSSRDTKPARTYVDQPDVASLELATDDTHEHLVSAFNIRLAMNDGSNHKRDNSDGLQSPPRNTVESSDFNFATSSITAISDHRPFPATPARRPRYLEITPPANIRNRDRQNPLTPTPPPYRIRNVSPSLPSLPDPSSSPQSPPQFPLTAARPANNSIRTPFRTAPPTTSSRRSSYRRRPPTFNVFSDHIPPSLQPRTPADLARRYHSTNPPPWTTSAPGTPIRAPITPRAAIESSRIAREVRTRINRERRRLASFERERNAQVRGVRWVSRENEAELWELELRADGVGEENFPVAREASGDEGLGGL